MQATGQALQEVGNTKPNQMQLFDTIETVRAVADDKPVAQIKNAIDSSTNLTPEQKTILKNFAKDTSEKSLSLMVSENPKKALESTSPDTMKQNEPTTQIANTKIEQDAGVQKALDEVHGKNLAEIFSKEKTGLPAPTEPKLSSLVGEGKTLD